jgi:mercuric ion binding protein
MTKQNFLLGTITLIINWTLMVPSSLGSPTTEGLASQTYSLENLTCATCPITVRKAMSRVDEVQEVGIYFD